MADTVQEVEDTRHRILDERALYIDLVDQAASDKAYTGAQLRAARLAATLSLDEVERRTAGYYKASVVGAYERGERSCAAHRVTGLARLYRAVAADLLPAGTELERLLDGVHDARRALAGVTYALEQVPGLHPAAAGLLLRADRYLKRSLDLVAKPTAAAVTSAERDLAEDVVA